MVWILVSEKANQLTCNICPYMYYDERTEWYTCKRIKRSVNACVWDEKRHDKCPIQAADTPPVPAADVVEVKHGQWIFQTYEYMPWCTKAICSSCKQTIANNADLSQDWGKRLFLKDNLFCAKCGAKMEGGKNE